MTSKTQRNLGQEPERRTTPRKSGDHSEVQPSWLGNFLRLEAADGEVGVVHQGLAEIARAPGDAQNLEIDLAVDLRADEEHGGIDVEEEQEDRDPSDRAVRLVVAAELVYIDPECRAQE